VVFLDIFWKERLLKIKKNQVKMESKNYEEINIRYSELAESSCCLSCGGAVNYAKPAKGEVCIDLGSGRGTDAIRMADSVGPEGAVFGIDISEGMIKKSNDTVNRLGVGNVKFIQSTLEKINLESNTADLVISNCTINHSEDKQAVWNEVFRILKSNGRFVVSDIYALNTIPEEYSKDPAAISECWAGSVTRDVYLKHLESAGFTSIAILEESKPYAKGKADVVSWTITGEKL
jgi:arsenite methyltransferase